MNNPDKIDVTVILAVKNEAANIRRCLQALEPATKVFVLDSQSDDNTCEIAQDYTVEVIQFYYQGGYPKKRQWAMQTLDIPTEWIMFIDADEVVTKPLWQEIKKAIGRDDYDAYFIKKWFHFMGKPLKFGGFSHSAILLLRKDCANFEHLVDEPSNSLDMEVHERVIVSGRIGCLDEPLIHEDFKDLESYIQRHNKYSSWEARVRYQFLTTGKWGFSTVKNSMKGNIQEKRRFIKSIIMRIPFEHILWFLYHYLFRCGFLEGRRGWIASRIRSGYIADVHDKIYELKIRQKRKGISG